MDTVRWVFGLLLVVGLPPGLTWWFLVHPFVGFWRRAGVRVTLTAMTTFFVAVLVGLYAAREVLMGADLGGSPLLAAGGVLLLTGAFAIAIARRKQLTTPILMGVPELRAGSGDPGVLLREGPYARIRHPRYVELVLACFGYAAISNHVGPWVVAVASLPVFHAVVVLEERELTARFGDAYREYARRVPRYLPRRRAPGGRPEA